MTLKTINKFADEKGLTEQTVRKLITRHWTKGLHWVKTPANRIMIDTVAVEEWERSEKTLNIAEGQKDESK